MIQFILGLILGIILGGLILFLMLLPLGDELNALLGLIRIKIKTTLRNSNITQGNIDADKFYTMVNSKKNINVDKFGIVVDNDGV